MTERCPTCGQSVRVMSDLHGVSHYEAGREVEQLQEAARPFANFACFLSAMREVDGEDPLDPHQIVMQVQGGGGTAMLLWENFQKVCAALAPIEVRFDG